MTTNANTTEPLVRSVFHPSDFTDASESAFAHSLVIALFPDTRFTILHVEASPSGDIWTQFPAIQSTLKRWGYLEEDSALSGVLAEFSSRVDMVTVQSRRPVTAILEFVEEHPPELVVLSTRGREGMPRWIQRSVSEPVARRSNAMTLFVPAGARGFVDPANGSVSLKRIVLPMGRAADPQATVDFVARLATYLGDGPVAITLLHIGDNYEMPEPDLPQSPSCSWNKLKRGGEVVEGILATAEETGADLIAMATAGHEGILDALRGSTTEQVLRRAPCPVLAVPAR